MTSSSGHSRSGFLGRRFGSSARYDLSDPLGREARFQAQLLKIVTAVLFFISTSLLTVLLPFYPIGLAAILSLVAAILGFIFPPLGFIVGVAFSIPSLAYQTGVPLWWLGILAIFCLGFSVRMLLDPSNVFAPALGMISAATSLTSAYFLAVPLMIAVVLSRGKEKLLAPLEVVIMFFVFFIPIHQAEFASLLQNAVGAKLQTLRAEEIYDAMNSLAIPLFRQVALTPRPAPESFDAPALNEAFGAAFRASRFFHPYLFLMIDRLIVLYFPILIAMTLSISLMVERFWHWLGERTASIAPILGFSAFFTIAVGTAIFTMPLLALAAPLRYFTALTSSASQSVSGSLAVGAMITSAGMAGLFLSILDRWLTHRNQVASTASAIGNRSRELSDTLGNIIRHLSSVVRSSEGIDISGEIAEVNKSNEEIKLTIENLPTMKLSVMSDRLSKFRSIGENLPIIEVSANRKLLNVHLEKIAKYNSNVDRLQSLTVRELQKIPVPDETKVAEKNGHDLVNDQNGLNQKYLELAVKTLSITTGTVETIRSEFEDIDETAVEVAKQFVADKRGEVALDYLVNTLTHLNDRYHSLVSKIVQEESSMINRAIEIYSSYMFPMYETLDKDETSSKSYNVVMQLDSVRDVSRSVGIALLPEAMKRFQILKDGLKTIIEELSSHLTELEALNDSRAPGFNWGKNTTLMIDLETAMKALESRARKGIDEKISTAKSALTSIEEAAKTISQYLITCDLILQYPLFEPLIVWKLKEAGEVSPDQIPVAQKYARQYLRLYASKHSSEVGYDIMATKLLPKK